jgi:ATP-dependent RNA helicase DHX37/DHR1
MAAALKTVTKIHRRLPPGGILVFLSGQREVETMVRWLHRKFPSLPKKSHGNGRKPPSARKLQGNGVKGGEAAAGKKCDEGSGGKQDDEEEDEGEESVETHNAIVDYDEDLDEVFYIFLMVNYLLLKI